MPSCLLAFSDSWLLYLLACGLSLPSGLCLFSAFGPVSLLGLRAWGCAYALGSSAFVDFCRSLKEFYRCFVGITSSGLLNFGANLHLLVCDAGLCFSAGQQLINCCSFQGDSFPSLGSSLSALGPVRLREHLFGLGSLCPFGVDKFSSIFVFGSGYALSLDVLSFLVVPLSA